MHKHASPTCYFIGDPSAWCSQFNSLSINPPCDTSRWNMSGRSISNAREMLGIMPVLVHIMWLFIFPLKLLLQKRLKSWKLHGKEQNRINLESIWGATSSIQKQVSRRWVILRLLLPLHGWNIAYTAWNSKQPINQSESIDIDPIPSESNTFIPRPLKNNSPKNRTYWMK